MLRLQAIEISRFRGIREGRLEDFADVNVLIGRNNAGKSTVIEAIAWSLSPQCAPNDPLGRNAMDTMLKWRSSDSQMNSDIWYRQDQSETVTVVSTVGDVNFVRGVLQSGGRLDPKVDQTNPAWRFGRALTLFHPSDGMNPQVEQKLWPRLLANRSDKRLTRMLNEIYGLDAEGFQLLPDKSLLVMFPEYSVGVDLQGDGTRAAIRCLMLLAGLRSTLFILEEPESHQHPGSLERFALAICKQAKEQDVQVLISTHSSECVRSFLAASESAGSESAVFHLQREDGVLEANRLDRETVQSLQATGVDVRCLDLYK